VSFQRLGLYRHALSLCFQNSLFRLPCCGVYVCVSVVGNHFEFNVVSIWQASDEEVCVCSRMMYQLLKTLHLGTTTTLKSLKPIRLLKNYTPLVNDFE
jgi:hypothetical protein